VTQDEMQLTESQIEQAISDHDARNAELRRTFIKKGVDLDDARMVEFHFRTWSKEAAAGLSKALEDRGFLVVLKHPAVFSSDPSFWNVEATIRQSIELTLRHEFTDELVRVAARYSGRYDGWDARPSAISRGA
jgi:predicted membrane-bound spermidine synthase